MMGQREGGQGQFFYAFDLDKVVPADHLVRQIDAVLDLHWVHKELAPYYSHTGRPSIDPVLMIRMLVGGEGFSVDASLIKADLDKKKRAPGDQPIAWPKAEEASRAVREYLMALDAARNDEESGGDDSGVNGGSRRSAPKEVSLTDPLAAWVARKGTDPFFAYNANYLIAEGTRANRAAEIAITETMVDRIKRRFDLQPQRLAGDSVYGAVRLLRALVDRKITPHV